ncbi:coenzyme F420-reducing hydrogenase, FrhD protein [Methanococcus maripaludis]|uniref:Coenzyme F420 hydrogenase subunit delta n=1 Tax=Methanococcus maripaludis TaxID=39152 RepID=A0A2L1C8D2_METMI|nr:coenzyme F420-reducing hydrogenase, FrhD protein [Methanococcus maripaludis]AVB75597.1 coenzyme F420-dependent hydrogenase subunit delta [Methanococcus maripaludis]MBA2863922.1 coenzyme F420 hydrogenase subunit delta [Methanococcus maripaludis]MBB6496072.1 coenzyme F420 hydrogenase subunit delta [Methanococcus maripaludis]
MPEYLEKEVLVLGCGNILFGDDGFGYAVVNKLNELKKEHHILESNKIQIIDAGTGASHFILSLIDEKTPLKKIIIADVIDYGLTPGELKKLYSKDLPDIDKYHIDAHDMPLAGMLKDIEDNYGVKIVVIGCQQKNVPAPDILLELSDEVNAAVDGAVSLIIDELNE